ncbi:MAG: sulfotransferase domain-containing protein [Chthoniobacterales bacterium]
MKLPRGRNDLVHVGQFSAVDVLAAAHLRLINDSDPGDFFVAGYPKSGNTWMQLLLAGVLFGADARLAPDSLVQDLIPDVHHRKFYRRYSTPTFFKTHELPQPEYRNVIYLVRDGRDAMVSYYHHLSALGASPDFLQLVSTGNGLFPSLWHEHVEAWSANPYGARMMIVKYERLKEDAVAELKRICEFAKLDSDPKSLASVVENSAFEIQREKEKKVGWEGQDWPRDKPFVRRGKVGSFKDEMPEPVLKAFMERSGPALQMLGYI